MDDHFRSGFHLGEVVACERAVLPDNGQSTTKTLTVYSAEIQRL